MHGSMGPLVMVFTVITPVVSPLCSQGWGQYGSTFERNPRTVVFSTPAFDQIRLADDGPGGEELLIDKDIQGYRVQRRSLPIRPGLSIDVLTAADQAIVREDSVAKNIDPFGSTVWPSSLAAAIDLCDVANVLRDGTLDGVTVLELGAGTGVASYTAAALGAKVIATDVAPLSLALLEAGAGLQVSNHAAQSGEAAAPSVATPTPFRGELKAQYFDVCDDSVELPQCDILVSADMLYNPSLTAAVARRCIEAAERYGAGLIITSPPGRSGEQRFLRLLELSGSVQLGSGGGGGGGEVEGGEVEGGGATHRSPSSHASPFAWNDAILPAWADSLWAAGSLDSMTQVVRSLPASLNRGLDADDAAAICYNGRWPTLKKRSGRTRAAHALAALTESSARWAANEERDGKQQSGEITAQDPHQF